MAASGCCCGLSISAHTSAARQLCMPWRSARGSVRSSSTFASAAANLASTPALFLTTCCPLCHPPPHHNLTIASCSCRSVTQRRSTPAKWRRCDSASPRTTSPSCTGHPALASASPSLSPPYPQPPPNSHPFIPKYPISNMHPCTNIHLSRVLTSLPGKTSTVAVAIQALVARGQQRRRRQPRAHARLPHSSPGLRVLVCAPSNVAVDNITGSSAYPLSHPPYHRISQATRCQAALRAARSSSPSPAPSARMQVC